MNNLAAAYRLVGRYREAVDLFEKVFAVREKRLGPEHPETLTSLNNLAVAYRLAGRLTEAISFHGRASHSPGRGWVQTTPTY